jgi:hypothetical protein
MSEVKTPVAPKAAPAKAETKEIKANPNAGRIDEPMEESIFDNLYPNKEEEVLTATGTPTTKKRSRYVTIRHNASENYSDKTKAAELGVDLYPGGFSREMELAAIERGGKNFFKTGLKEADYKQAWEVEFLKESLVTLEENFGPEVNDPFNQPFWKKQRLAIVDEETVLDLENPDNLLTYWNIKGGGYPYIAASPDDLLKTNYRFYLEEPHLTYEVYDDSEKIRDKAVRLLSEIDESGRGAETMFFLHKMLITSNEGVTFNTPKDIIYKALRRYIQGDYTQGQKKQAPKKFIETVESFKSNQKRGRTIALVNDAIFYGNITTNKDNQFVSNETTYNFKTKDKEKLVEELMKFQHQEEVVALLTAVQQKWNKY